MNAISAALRGATALTGVATLVLTAAATATATASPAAAPPSAMAGSGVALAVADEPLQMPNEVPRASTPDVPSGEVREITRVGTTMIAGGTFSAVSDPEGNQTLSRTNLFAFDEATGRVSRTFSPQLNGVVQALLPGPTAGTVYVAGSFTTVNGQTYRHVALLDVATGAPVTTFTPPANNGTVHALARDGDRLFIGGTFARVGGQDHAGIASLDARTGALDPYVDLQMTEHHNNTGSGAQAGVGAREMVLTPDGSRLVVIGNFRKVDGLDRNQLVMVSLPPAGAVVTPDWATNRYAPYCFNWAFDTTMRGLALSPDGEYFVITATGGHNAGTLCDTAARWEVGASGTGLQPTWVAESGGDTLWGVGITDAAVFIGGHSRWMNNPYGSDSANQGAVPRPGLAALDPGSGVPLDWNPGRNPRGEAAYAFLPTEDGLWMTSNTDWVGNRRYRHERVAFFPYAGGAQLAREDTARLPGNVVVASTSRDSNVLYRVNAGGPLLLSDDSGPDWAADTAATSPFRNTGSNAAGYAALDDVTANVPATTPRGIFSTERWDPSGGDEMEWAFPVPAGEDVTVRLYFANRCTCTSAEGSRRFNVSIDGDSVLPSYDIVADVGDQRGTMRAYDVVSDGSVDIEFGHVVENPLVNGIEVVAPGVAPGGTESARVVAFDGSTVTSEQSLATPGFDWARVRGGVMVGDRLVYASSDRYLHARTFDGESFGPDRLLDPYHDPAWAGVDTGSGNTYDGRNPDWFNDLGRVTGLFYADDRLYYTMAGDSTLHWRWFSADSGAVSPVDNAVPSSGVDWASARGMFLDGTDLYVVSGDDGSLGRADFSGGSVSGPVTVVDSPATGGVDWRGRAVFVTTEEPPPANELPTAAFAFDCTALDCAFDGRDSSDDEGPIDSYAWDFGDGATGTGAQPTHSYDEPGAYAVTLTVTDGAGATASLTRTVTVQPPAASDIELVGVASVAANNRNPRVELPAAAAAGDRALLFLSRNNVDRSVSAPTGVGGWTQLDAVTAGTMGTTVWSKALGQGDAGNRVTVSLSGAAKYTLTVAVYRGVAAGAPSHEVATFATRGTSRTAPAVTTPEGAWVVSYFADKSGSTTSWTVNATTRDNTCAPNAGRICSALADSGGPVPAGTRNGATATTNAASRMATAWSILLPPS